MIHVDGTIVLGSLLSACVKVVLYHHHLHQSQTVSQSDPRKLRSPTNICLIYMKRGGDKKRKGSKVQLENTILIQTWNFCSWLFLSVAGGGSKAQKLERQQQHTSMVITSCPSFLITLLPPRAGAPANQRAPSPASTNGSPGDRKWSNRASSTSGLW